MLTLFIVSLATVVPAPQAQTSPDTTKLPHLYRQFRQSEKGDVRPPNATAVFIRVPYFENGGASQPLPVMITVYGGRDSELLLQQLLERLGEKPAVPRP